VHVRRGFFRPVAEVRAILAPRAETDDAGSNAERDIENFNISKSWQSHMFFGQGFGHAFTQFVPANDFSQSRFGQIGHNGILWLLFLGGVFGFTGVLLYLAVAVFLIGLTLKRTGVFRERVALLVALSVFITYLMQAFGDMGLISSQFAFFVGVSVAIAGRLAAKHGVLVPEAEAPPMLLATR